MKNPILALARAIAAWRGRSEVPTGLIPLKKVRRATVFVEALQAEEDPERISRAVSQYFAYMEIPVRILCPGKEDLNWMGYRKSALRAADPDPEDLFISLARSPENFASEYEARCSRARFKVGRCQLPGDVFDLVVAESGDTRASQTAAFSSIKDYLTKIR